MPKIFLPYVEILWKEIPVSLKEIRAAGFDGVECHLIGGLRYPKRALEVCEEARVLGLGVQFHQGWSKETGQPNMYNVVLNAIGALVPNGMPLKEQIFPEIRKYPVVLYGNSHNWVSESGWNCRYQTDSQYCGEGYSGQFETFQNAVLRSNGTMQVVFDTQHVLEWSQNAGGVEGLSRSPATVGWQLMEYWRILGPSVVEIHLNDFDPLLGRTKGRNVFPGSGICPLDEFCSMVRRSGWDGVVVPEVAPQYLKTVDQLRYLRDKMSIYFPKKHR